MIPLNKSYGALLKRLFGVENDEVGSVSPSATPVFDVGDPPPVTALQILSDAHQFSSTVFGPVEEGGTARDTWKTKDFKSMKLMYAGAHVENNSTGSITVSGTLYHEPWFLGTKITRAAAPISITATAGSVGSDLIPLAQPLVIPTSVILSQNTDPALRNYRGLRFQFGTTSGTPDPDIEIYITLVWELVPKVGSVFPVNSYFLTEGTFNDL